MGWKETGGSTLDWFPGLLDWNKSTCDPFACDVGGGGVIPGRAGGPAAHLQKLGIEGLAVGWAAAIQANMIWLVSAATVILNLLKEINVQNGTSNNCLQKVGSKKLEVKSLPWNWTVFVMNPHKGIGPFAPWEEDQMGWHLLHIE
jgi:hypothetical protein